MAGKPRQLDAVSVGGRGKKGGIREAARQLGLSEADVRRAIKVASLSPEAVQAAYRLGLADNRAALLRAADETTPEDQPLARKCVNLTQFPKLSTYWSGGTIQRRKCKTWYMKP